MAKNNYDPVGTLSVGNVVTTATTLYKSNFKRYFQVSVRATGWLLAIGFLAIGLTLLGGILYGLTNSWLTTIPFGLGAITATLYCLAKYATNRAVICRLAYQELIDAPETVAVATKQLIPRTWGFLRLSCLVGFYLFLVAFIGYIVMGILVVTIIVAASYIFGLSISNPNPFIYLCFGLLAIGLILWWIVILIRYYAYWFIAELPLAIEQTRSANFSIGRSNQLSKTATRRLVLIIAIAFLITLPINAIGNIPSFIGQIISSAAISQNSATQTMGASLVSIGLLLNLVAELFVMPFWQTIKAIVYYDLRNRREGGDLII
jgi:MFS family permease